MLNFRPFFLSPSLLTFRNVKNLGGGDAEGRGEGSAREDAERTAVGLSTFPQGAQTHNFGRPLLRGPIPRVKGIWERGPSLCAAISLVLDIVELVSEGPKNGSKNQHGVKPDIFTRAMRRLEGHWTWWRSR